MIEPAAIITNLEFGRDRFALRIPNLAVRRGRITCIVGANGSGKTTILELMVGLIRPGQGQIIIGGKTITLDEADAKRHIGYVPDDEGWVVAELTAREYFSLLVTLYTPEQHRAGATRYSNILAEQLLFTEFDQQLGAMSHGQRRKAQIIAGLMHRPDFLVIDELRNGLDPVAINRAERLLDQYCRNGGTVLAATHDLWWAERFADDVIMLKDGQIILHDTKLAIIRRSGSLEQAFLDRYEGAV